MPIQKCVDVYKFLMYILPVQLFELCVLIVLHYDDWRREKEKPFRYA